MEQVKNLASHGNLLILRFCTKAEMYCINYLSLFHSLSYSLHSTTMNLIKIVRSYKSEKSLNPLVSVLQYVIFTQLKLLC